MDADFCLPRTNGLRIGARYVSTSMIYVLPCLLAAMCSAGSTTSWAILCGENTGYSPSQCSHTAACVCLSGSHQLGNLSCCSRTESKCQILSTPNCAPKDTALWINTLHVCEQKVVSSRTFIWARRLWQSCMHRTRCIISAVSRFNASLRIAYHHMIGIMGSGSCKWFGTCVGGQIMQRSGGDS